MGRDGPRHDSRPGYTAPKLSRAPKGVVDASQIASEILRFRLVDHRRRGHRLDPGGLRIEQPGPGQRRRAERNDQAGLSRSLAFGQSGRHAKDTGHAFRAP